MKTVAKAESYPAANIATTLLKREGIYACVSGCKDRYDIMVRDSQQAVAKQILGTANVQDGAREPAPEVTAK